jgi:hypothetical protein
MRRVFAMAGVVAMVTFVTAAAHGWYDGVELDNTDNTSTDPNATTNGLFWIDTGSGPVLLNNDINAQFVCGATASSMTLLTNLFYTPGTLANGPQYSTYLISNGTATDFGTPGLGDITAFRNGLFCDPFGVEWVTTVPPEGTPAYFQIQAWTGTYNDYDDAYAASARGVAGVYAAQSSIFTNPVALGSFPIQVPPDLTNMPAVVLTRGLLGDANYDGKVDINDLTVVLANYGQTGMTWSSGDFIGDGKVDINDLTIVLANYGATISSAGIQGVPEPSALVLIVVGMLGLWGAARRLRTR